MKREELLQSPAYWRQKIQLDLFNYTSAFMKEHNMNKAQLAKYLAISKNTVNKLLSCDYNGNIEELSKVLIKLGLGLKVVFVPYPEIDYNRDLNDFEEFSIYDKNLQSTTPVQIPYYDTVSGDDTIINVENTENTNLVYIVQTFFDGRSYIGGVFNSKESAQKLVEKLEAKRISDEIFSITKWDADIGECINVIDYE